MRMGIHQVASIVFGAALLLFADSSEVDKKVDVSGWFWVSAGRFESANDDIGQSHATLDGSFWEDIHIGTKLQLYPQEKTRLTLHTGAFFQQNYTFSQFKNIDVKRDISFYLIEASVHRSIGDSTLIPMYLDFGYFPVRYNKNSRNLGEYLLRSGAYPPAIASGFELSDKVKALGLRFGAEPVQGLHVDAMVTSEIAMFPFYDFGLVALAQYSPNQLFSVGAGWMGSRLWSVDSTKTVPGNDTGRFKIKRSSTDFKEVAVYDSATNDTVLLSHSGHKFEFNFEFNPRSLLNTTLLGESDLKLYGEVGLLGLKKYPLWYTKWAERMPMMVGLNLPTHPLMSGGIMTALALLADASSLDSEKVMLPHPDKMWKSGIWGVLGAGTWALHRYMGLDTWLDVLAVEVEYYESPYYNSLYNVTANRSPAPFDGGGTTKSYDNFKPHHNDDWKWSVYAAKKIGKSFTLSGQIANDNSNRLSYTTYENYHFPMFRNPENWYWMMRAKFAF